MTPTRNNAGVSRRSLLGLLAASPFAGMLAGCGSIVPGQGPPPDLYRLSPKHAAAAQNLAKVDWQLLVEPPAAPAGIDSTRIGLMHNPIQLEYYARSNWIDRVPLMVQTLTVDSFESSGRILSVGGDSSNLRPDFILATEVRDFQAEYFSGPAPHAHVAINARLVTVRRRAIVAAKRFDHDAAAASDRIEDIVAAFNSALGQVLDELVPWTLETGEADRKTG